METSRHDAYVCCWAEPDRFEGGPFFVACPGEVWRGLATLHALAAGALLGGTLPMAPADGGLGSARLSRSLFGLIRSGLGADLIS